MITTTRPPSFRGDGEPTLVPSRRPLSGYERSRTTTAAKRPAAKRGHVERANNQDDYIYEALHLRKDGTVFPALTHVSALKDAEGELLYRAATVRVAGEG